MSDSDETIDLALGSTGADATVGAIFAVLERCFPGTDPGDITITVQDDMPLVTIEQTHLNLGRLRTNEATLERALTAHLRTVESTLIRGRAAREGGA